jgi:hypothetical protein
MNVTIHQPNFLPWLGFFAKMNASEIFVLLDCVQFTKGGFQNRVQIKSPSGSQWLTVPVKLMNSTVVTNEVQIDENPRWKDNHLKSILQNYRKSANFDSIYPLVSKIYEFETLNLSEFCINAIRLISELLDINRQMVLASELNTRGSGGQLLISILEDLKATSYLSGPSGKRYLNLDDFHERNLSVSYSNTIELPRNQLYPPFVPGLSIVDFLFNEKPENWKEYLNNSSEISI